MTQFFIFYFFNNLPNPIPALYWVQIGEFDLAHEAAPVVDERLLEKVNLATKLPTAKVGFHTGNWQGHRSCKEVGIPRESQGIGLERDRNSSYITSP